MRKSGEMSNSCSLGFECAPQGSFMCSSLGSQPVGLAGGGGTFES